MQHIKQVILEEARKLIQESQQKRQPTRRIKQSVINMIQEELNIVLNEGHAGCLADGSLAPPGTQPTHMCPDPDAAKVVKLNDLKSRLEEVYSSIDDLQRRVAASFKIAKVPFEQLYRGGGVDESISGSETLQSVETDSSEGDGGWSLENELKNMTLDQKVLSQLGLINAGISAGNRTRSGELQGIRAAIERLAQRLLGQAGGE